MQNVKMTVEGNKLTIEVDLSEEHGPSSSGKTTIIATTSGNAPVEGKEGVQVGLNVFKKRGK
jgi:hypothetical protein